MQSTATDVQVIQFVIFETSSPTLPYATQIYAKKESGVIGNTKQYSGTDLFIQRAYFNSSCNSLSHASKK